MKHVLSLSVFILCASNLNAVLIPADKLVTWEDNVGVAGGIPNRTTIFTTLSATGSGDAAIIQAALDAAGLDEVIKLNPGTYVLESNLNMHSREVLRGSGPTTILQSNRNGGNIISFTGSLSYYLNTAISGSPAKGATSVTVAATTDMAVGTKVQIQQDNDGAEILTWAGAEGTGGPWSKGQWVEVTNIAGTTVTFTPPLYAAYSAAQNPRFYWNVNAGTPANNDMALAGVENLTITNLHSTNTANVSMSFTTNCWLKNITSNDGGLCHVWMLDTYRCEIRDSYFHGILAPITSSRGYGIQTGTTNGGAPSAKTTALLVENNIFEGCRAQVIMGYGVSGSVIGYNYFLNAADDVATHLRDDIIFHSDFPHANLIEGNKADKFGADSFHGNSDRNVIHRNLVLGHYAGKTQALVAIELDIHQRNFAVVGNVLGYNGVVAAVATGALYETKVTTAYASTKWHAFMLGYDSENGSHTIDDTLVESTLTRKGNKVYDSTNNGAIPTAEDLGADSLVDSYYLPGKPSWFGGLTYPPVLESAQSIPAEYRYVNGAPPAIGATSVSGSGHTALSGAGTTTIAQ